MKGSRKLVAYIFVIVLISLCAWQKVLVDEWLYRAIAATLWAFIIGNGIEHGAHAAIKVKEWFDVKKGVDLDSVVSRPAD